ncbi:hypothetical protein T09_13869 [Trichinella sp. T9]|nr:hypothetical protein T09_13869 [Trichinella sp. T9]
MTAGSCHGGLADQALKVRTLDVLRDQMTAHNETSSTLLSLFQSSLLLGQSRTPLLLRFAAVSFISPVQHMAMS